MKAESFEKACKAAETSTHDIDRYHQQVKADTWESLQPLELLVDLDRVAEITTGKAANGPIDTKG